MKLEHVTTALCYEKSTGIFRWKIGARSGEKAGCTFSNGYHYLRIDRRMIGAHRVAWFFIHGILPEQVDHINGTPSDNRIKNLRLSTQSQNRQNSRTRRDSKSGYKGVTYCADHRKWRGMIGPRGKVKHLGYFATAEEAHAAYVKAADEMYGVFARSE